MTRITRTVQRALGALVCAGLTWASLPAPTAFAVERVVSATTNVAIEISKGELYKLESPAATVFIADPDIADVQVMSATLIYIYGIRPGDTNLYAVGANDQIIANMQIHVVPNISQLDQAIDTIIPDSTVAVTAVQDSLVLTGAVNSAVEAADLSVLANEFVGESGLVINRARVHGPNQINVRVRFVEARREDVQRFGINWESVLSTGGLIFGLANGVDWLTTDDDGNRIYERSGDGYNAVGAYNRGSRDVNVMLDALENEGLVNILAEPNLTAVSGETASFLAGGEFPIPMRNSDGDFYVEFRQFGVSLSFTATLLADNLISMRVRPEVSELSDTGAVELDGFSIPALITRRAETTVEMNSGQTFAIAGLFQSRSSNSINAMPIMGDLPIIGALFRSEDYQRNETELVIMITPYLVQPPANQRIVSPGEPMASNSGTAGATAMASPVVAPGPAPSGLVGGGGFILQ